VMKKYFTDSNRVVITYQSESMRPKTTAGGEASK
jgi:hypothetical protein